MTLQIIDGPIIAAGQSLSDAVDLTAGEFVRITMPADWVYSGVGITFQISSDGGFFNDLVDRHGIEVSVAVVPGSALIVPEDIAGAAAFVKFRSGTSQAPVPQPAARLFAVALRVPDSEPPPADIPTVAIRLVR
jgi:hypothetical protein